MPNPCAELSILSGINYVVKVCASYCTNVVAAYLYLTLLELGSRSMKHLCSLYVFFISLYGFLHFLSQQLKVFSYLTIFPQFFKMRKRTLFILMICHLYF
jgi:hypothetical protein